MTITFLGFNLLVDCFCSKGGLSASPSLIFSFNPQVIAPLIHRHHVENPKISLPFKV